MRFRFSDVALTTGMVVMLGSCGTVGGRRDGRPHGTPRPQSRPAPRPVSDVPIKIGTPYQVRGVTYTPADPVSYDEVGYASWYGEEQNGNATANGEAFRAGAIAAAHRTLPLPSYVEVTALDSGRTILVRVNDRGPFSGDRLIDLSRGAAEQLRVMGRGTVAVRVRRVNPPEQERALLRNGGRAAERLTTPKPLLAALQDRLNSTQPRSRPVATTTASTAKLPSSRTGYIVQIAAFASQERAQALADRIRADVVPTGALWRVRFGPYPTAEAARVGITQAASKGFRDARIMAND